MEISVKPTRRKTAVQAPEELDRSHYLQDRVERRGIPEIDGQA
jgi:hypothetical protein